MNRPDSAFGKIEAMMMHGMAFETLLACLRLRVFDQLDTASVTADEFAGQFGFMRNRAEGMLDMLAAFGVLEKTPDGYRNTLLASEHLVSTAPFYQGNALDLNDCFNKFVCLHMEENLRGTTPARESSDENWAPMKSLKGSAEQAWLGSLQDTVEFITGLPAFDRMQTMCDIGGNHGEYSMELLRRNAELQGEILDLPEVVDSANRSIRQKGFADCLTARACDLRQDDLPDKAYDLVLASHVLYAFMDDLDACLSSIKNSIKPGGWFVSHHMDPSGALPRECAATVEFIARMAGYETHFIERERLEQVLNSVGFQNLITTPAGPDSGNRIMAAQVPH